MEFFGQTDVSCGEIMTGIGPVAVRCPRVRDRTSGKGAGAPVSRQRAGRNPSAQ
jgi:hypothetical protein